MAGLVEGQGDGGNYGRDRQIEVEVGGVNGLPADQRAERDSKKEGTVVPS